MAEPGSYHEAPESARRSPVVGRPEALRRLQRLSASLWEAADRAFPVRIPRSWFDAIDPDEPSDPLALQALPDARELDGDPGDLPDPVGDAARSPAPWVVCKHRDRVLLLLTKRCHLYCRYCFRRNHRPGEAQDPDPEEWERALSWCERSGARELILSGGDPLAVRDGRLLEVIDRLRPRIPVVRIHTRAPITAPERVTPALVAALAARQPVWLVVHANHPRELTAAARAALGRLVDAGVPVLNQSVLLRGVNDDVDTLAALSEALVSLRVFPYYLHHPDRASGNAHFRLGLEEGLALHRALARRVSGIALPGYVIDLPDGSGKIPVERALAEGLAG